MPPTFERRPTGASASRSTASRAGAGGTATRSCSTTARASTRRRASYLAPVEPTKILAVHLTYRSRVEEYAARTPPEPSYFVKPPTTLNGHRRPIRMAKGARFLNYEGELAVVVGRAMKGVPIDEVLDHVAGLHVRERRRDARLPPRRPRLDAAREGAGRLPPARPGARAGGGVRPDRLHAPHVPERRRRPGGDGRRPPVPGRVPARRPLPHDHARARATSSSPARPRTRGR